MQSSPQGGGGGDDKIIRNEEWHSAVILNGALAEWRISTKIAKRWLQGYAVFSRFFANVQDDRKERGLGMTVQVRYDAEKMKILTADWKFLILLLSLFARKWRGTKSKQTTKQNIKYKNWKSYGE